jgi:hypothetical protein
MNSDTDLTQQELDYLKLTTKFISIVVRNAMEDFHTKYLTDEQMKELNPTIRNAIFTALYAQQTMNKSQKIEDFVREQWAMIPSYWEEPELLEQFRK